MTAAEREQLATDHLRLAYWCIGKILGRLRREHREEAESAARLGLAQAINDHDPSRGMKFSAYVYNRVRWQLLRTAEKWNRSRDMTFFRLDPKDWSNGLAVSGRQERGIEVAEAAEAVEDLLKNLSDRYAFAIRSRYVDHMELKEIAAKMGITVQRVRIIICRGTIKLRKLRKWEPWGDRQIPHGRQRQQIGDGDEDDPGFENVVRIMEDG